MKQEKSSKSLAELIRDQARRKRTLYKPITSIREYKKKYFPLLYEAERVARLPKKEYLHWFISCKDKSHRDKVIEEMKRLANSRIQEGRDILNLLGY